MDNIFASIFGETPATKAARENRDSAFQAMLDTRKQVAETARTDNVRMARANALGNILTTMVQPLGWAIGGRGNHANTGGVQTYDNRAYLDAFNRAVKATDDVRNIGTAEDEYKLKLADEAYKRQLALDDQMRNAAIRQAQLETQAQQKLDYEKQRQADELEKIEARGEVQKWLAEYKATHRVVGRGGLSVDDRALIAARNNYEQYRRTRATQGLQPLTFEQYMKNEGYEVQDTTKTGGGSKTSSSGSSGRSHGGLTSGSSSAKSGREHGGLVG